MRRLHFALLSFVLAVAVQPLVAVTYYVGTCKIGAFGSISAAVAGVPAGSTIDVCPGTYAEQVVISKALTLQGIFSNNSSQAVIAVPSGGLATTSSLVLGTAAAQVEVTAGRVTITNITVDGTASSNCPRWRVRRNLLCERLLGHGERSRDAQSEL
jgi:pectin methylesterase-like acyl-CoA thioesterase